MGKFFFSLNRLWGLSDLHSDDYWPGEGKVGLLSLNVKQTEPEADSDHLPPCGSDVKNSCSRSFHSSHTFMSFLSVNHKHKFRIPVASIGSVYVTVDVLRHSQGIMCDS